MTKDFIKNLAKLLLNDKNIDRATEVLIQESFRILPHRRGGQAIEAVIYNEAIDDMECNIRAQAKPMILEAIKRLSL